MSQMPKTLRVPDLTQVTKFDDLKRAVQEFFLTIQKSYEQIHNDINFKEAINFSQGGKKWRIIPNGPSLDIQVLTGADWKNQSHWKTAIRLSGKLLLETGHGFLLETGDDVLIEGT